MQQIVGIFAICLLAFVLPLRAQEWIVTFDPPASEISFLLKATGHEVRGMLPLESGEVRWDSVNGAASGEIVVSARGAQTGNDMRDKKMHAEVLESELFPRFSFRAEALEGEIVAEGSSVVRLVGTLSVHGRDHPLTIEAEVEATDGRLNAVASFPVPYVEWGLRDPSVFVLRVAKSVAVKVELAGTLRTVESRAAP